MQVSCAEYSSFGTARGRHSYGLRIGLGLGIGIGIGVGLGLWTGIADLNLLKTT